MPRVKGGTVARKRRKKILKLAKGYYGAKHTLYKTAHEQVMKSLQYAYRDRKQRKRDFRKLWIARINAGARMHGMSYSQFMHGLKLANIDINRKMLSEIAIHDQDVFKQLVSTSQSAVNNTQKKTANQDVTKTAKKKIEVVEEKLEEVVEDIKEAAEYVAEIAKDMAELSLAELKSLAKGKGLSGYSTMKKSELVELLEKN